MNCCSWSKWNKRDETISFATDNIKFSSKKSLQIFVLSYFVSWVNWNNAKHSVFLSETMCHRYSDPRHSVFCKVISMKYEIILFLFSPQHNTLSKINRFIQSLKRKRQYSNIAMSISVFSEKFVHIQNFFFLFWFVRLLYL